MSKTLTLTWHFYKPLLVVNLVFSVVCIADLYKIGIWFIADTVMIKLVGYTATVFYKHYFANKNYLYYLNAGYSIKKMYGYVFSIDFGIYLLMVALFYLIKLICPF
jgi:hypothetical protein